MNERLGERYRDLAMNPGENPGAELSVPIAGAFARQGSLDEARRIVRDPRVCLGDGHGGPVTVRPMLAAGLIHPDRAFSPAAFDRMGRVEVLATAIRHRTAAAMASAWKAQVEFEPSKFDPMGRSLRSAVASADSRHDDAGARISIALSTAFSNAIMMPGNRRQAQACVRRERDHA